MSGISIGHPNPRSHLGENALKRCRNNYVESNDIILIDVDTEDFDSIVVIDVPESLPKKTQPSTTYRKDKKLSSRNVINIDDDEETDDINTNAGVAKKFPETPVRLSKCKRTYSGKASGRNRFGLDSSSEDDSSDDNNDYLDCELMEDDSGKVQELWEKAFSRRSKELPNNHSDTRNHGITSRVVDVDYCEEAHFGFRAGIFDNGDDSSSSRPKQETELGCSKDPFETKNSTEKEHLGSDEIGPCSRTSTFCEGFLGKILRDTHRNEAKLKEDAAKLNIIKKKEDNDGQMQRENGGDSDSVETCMISEREKLKETDEYKRAMEEEWASRQQALQIQAEEAKHQRRLQKRMKAESMRLLDMERRQKQRIEEVRDIQRKGEENMNLKESIRVEVRTELKRVETLCSSMASLLHLLGIRVGGWPNPLPQEVQTAYKQALLTFHPDRASQSDIRLQVEAEEKFKLINRLKEKFLPL